MKTWYLVPALDVADLDEAARLVAAVADHPAIHSFKVGFSLGLSSGLPRVVEAIRRHSDKPVVYDHQKAGTDIPDTGALFARTLARAGVDAAILFPQAGPVTLRAWVEACQGEGLGVIVGALMTHPGYVASEGGFLEDAAIPRMWGMAAEAGVRDFVVPLTRPDATRAAVQAAGLDPAWTYWSPGYGAQGGDPAAFGFLHRHHLIVGRALLRAPDPVAWLDAAVARLAALEKAP